MDTNTQERLLTFLNASFNRDGTIYLLAVSAKVVESSNPEDSTCFKVRVALTYRENEALNPYFDGTDMYVVISPTDIQFTREDEWADGPPIMEGSPIELALEWVAELAVPFWVTPEAQTAATNHQISSIDTNQFNQNSKT